MNNPKKTVLTTSIAAFLVLGAAGGGLAYTKTTVDGADRTAATKVWHKPEEALSDGGSRKEEDRPAHPLSDDLLPLPGGYTLGPDIQEFGNDAYLSSEKAAALLRKGAADLPSKAREQRREFVEDLDVKGMAMRSYRRDVPSDLVVELRLSQMNNEDAVKGLSSVQSALAEAFSVFRAGPEIDGHKNAKCFLPEAGDGKTGLEEMFCTAYQGDTLVSVTATGTAPLAEDEVATLLTNQLDRLATGGGMRI